MAVVSDVIKPARVDSAVFNPAGTAIDDWTRFTRQSLPPQFVREIHQKREAGGEFFAGLLLDHRRQPLTNMVQVDLGG